MSKIKNVGVGNDFISPKLPLRNARLPAQLNLVTQVNGYSGLPSVTPIEIVSRSSTIPVTYDNTSRAKIMPSSSFINLAEILNKHSTFLLCLFFLIVAISGVEVGGQYLSARLNRSMALASVSGISEKSPVAGLNIMIPAADLATKLQAITGQTAKLNLGSQIAAINSQTIRSWISITPNSTNSEDYLHVNPQTIDQSLNQIADKYVIAPVNQVSVTHNGTSQVILGGQNGEKMLSSSSLSAQANEFAKNVMSGKGLNFSAPLISQPFQAVTASAFSKLIEVDVNTHQMYLYDNGNLTRSYPISAGAPATPTPIGEFHVWEKLTEQTMTGFNTNGTRYVQPNVQWINYFDHSGDAVHGNYWRPLSVFGNVNTSHGCVSLPNAEAEWVYDWAPIGTTVITHN
jgi:hypothetical protein